jgi:PAS domain S-box-containing protein
MIEAGRSTVFKPEAMQQEMVPALAEAFSAFTDSAMNLSLTYKNLEKQLERVNKELEIKNRQLNESLQEKERLENYLRSILESMNSGIIAVDLDGNITMFNKSAQDFWGIPAPDAIGKKYQDVINKDAPIIIDTVKTLLPYSREEVIQSPQNGTLNVESSTSLVRDENNQVLGALEVIVDLTAWRKLEEQVQRVKTLAAMGEMSVSIAHDLRNPLAAIQLSAETLQNGECSQQERRRAATDILEGVNSMNKTVSNLLTLTRPVTLNLQIVNLARLLDDALLLCDYALRQNNIKVIKNYPQWGLNCEVDPDQFRQVALNLILNAVEAMPNGGKLRICAQNLDDHSLIELRFEDNGIGIPRELHQKIFHPFVTTKERGMGLGLSIVHKILASHSATIAVEGKKEEMGTSFILQLPVQQDTFDNSHETPVLGMVGEC